MSVKDVENMVVSIISVPLDDGVNFRIKQISEIMDEADYPGVRVSLEAEFDHVRPCKNCGTPTRRSFPMRQICRGTPLCPLCENCTL